MRKYLRRAWQVLGITAFLLVFAFTAISWSARNQLQRVYKVKVAPVAIPANPEAVAQGRHLAATRGCYDCHAEDLGGLIVIDDLAMGRVAAPNLTRGPGGLPATFSDEDWVRAIRHGIAPDGHPLFLMPSTDYAPFSDEDLGALIAYLKSVPPVNRASGPVQPGPMARVLMFFGAIKPSAELIDHEHLEPTKITPALTVEYGRYVAHACTGCHGPNFSGGKVASGPPDWPPAANLTPHAAGRLGKWSEADFLNLLRTGKRPDGSAVSEVMPRAFGQLNELEQKSLWLFLKSLPPVATGER
jgi:mono/diheme cytochrome c family protein